jgi:hypothetical protein
MEVKKIFFSQYSASLNMLKNTVEMTDNETWLDKNYKNAFWHVAYHALFYTDFYLSEDEKKYTRWTKHRPDYHYLGALPGTPDKKPDIEEPYSQKDILEYISYILNTLKEKIEKTNLEIPSGFYWLPFNKLELQLYNIRHLQHHTGQLMDRLRNKHDIGIKWITKGGE